MFPRTPLRFGFFLGLAILAPGFVTLGGCKDKGGSGKTAVTAETWFPVKVGDRTVKMQIMLLDSEMMQGLMYREKLGADEGMLFVNRYPKQMSFWMRNTLLPLDIGYFDAKGELRETYQMFPRDERPVASHAKDLQFALEMNQGWFAKQGVKTGAKLDLAAVKAAVDARGFSPERWNLK